MLKRKYGNRPNWTRVLERQYAQYYVESEVFRGYISLLKIIKVKEPLYVKYNDQQICIVNDGYFWLQQFPSQKHHAVTTMFNEKGQIVQWYIDVCYENGIDENNIPWMDDLYLDVVVLASGEIILKDVNELDDALHNGTIDTSLYTLAHQEANEIITNIKNNSFTLLQLAEEHRDRLLHMLK